MRKFDILNLIIPVVNIVIFLTSLFPAEGRETCPYPGASANGRWEGNCCFVEDVLKFSCKHGYEPVGQREIECLAGGSWSAPIPRCRPKETCTDPGVAVNGTREGNCCFKGDVLKFFCEDGYKTVGQQEIECLAGGSWSAPIPRCRPIGCKFPSRFLYGTVTYEHHADPQLLHYAPDNYILQFRCSEDYQMVGSKILFCARGAWTGVFPRCVDIYCSTPPSIANGTFSVTMGVNKRTVIGSTAKYSCLKCFELVNESANSLTCELNGGSALWVGELPKCKASACQYPEIPANGTIPQLKGINETTLPCGFHLTYECSKGFRLVGTSWNTCNNRRWAFETPKCEVITCYDPGTPKDGRRKGNNFEVGTKVSYTCSYLYRLLGSAERYCLKNGQWSGELTRCNSHTNFCPDPGTPINGMMTTHIHTYDEGYVVRYICNTGFFLVGSDTRVCQPNRVWTGVEPRCLGPYDFDNPMEVSERLERIVKDKAELQEHELHIYRDSLLKLTTRTNFTSLEKQETDVMRTEMLNLDFSGRIVLYFIFDSSGSIGEKNFRTGVEFAKALVRKVGLSPDGARVGALSFNSEAVAQFIPVEMSTTEAVIDALDRILYITGETNSSDALNTLLTDFMPMTRQFLGTKTMPVVFILTDGKTYMDGHTQLIAEELKEAGVEIYCIGITGSLARAPLYKVASTPEEEHVFILNDYNTLSYLTQIVINGTTAVLCQYPDIPSNGSIPQLKGRNETTFPYGFDLTYECNEGFGLVGRKWNTCDKGIWIFETPKCEADLCQYPDIPSNGSIPQLKGRNETTFPYGFHLTYECNEGFGLVGRKWNTCDKGIWIFETPKCEGPYDFDNKVEISEHRDSLMKLTTRTNFSSIEELEIAVTRTRIMDLNFPGRIIMYFIFDSSGSVGETNFRTSVEFAKALVRKVGVTPAGARAGAISFSSQAVVQFLPVELQTTDEVIDALDKMKYLKGGTATSDALDKLLTDVMPLTEELLGTKTKSVVFILTDGKANIGGDPQQKAEELKEAGAEIYCIGISGSLLKASLYKVASDPKDEHVFILNDYNTMSYLIQVIINGTIDYSECGLGLEKVSTWHETRKWDTRSRILGGKQAVEPWPWMAALFIVNPERGPQAVELKCGGSVIGREWILTAAHCVLDKENGNAVRDPKTVIIKLGLTHVKNESNLLEFEALEFKIHERYDPETLDYNIALIKLDREIDYSAYIRPVCLPPEELGDDTSLYKFRENAFAIGWGYDKKRGAKEVVRMKTVEHLKELRLPIQSDERCRKSLEYTGFIFTDQMFCAGSGAGEVDTCQGDSGGPIMQSQLNEEGNVYWVQTGVVSWGIGCGQVNTYGFYTHVQRLRAWILETMNTN